MKLDIIFKLLLFPLLLNAVHDIHSIQDLQTLQKVKHAVQGEQLDDLLQWASSIGDYQMVDELLSWPNIDVNCQDVSGQTPLYTLMIRKTCVDLIGITCKNDGPQILRQPNRNHLKTIKLLLENGAEAEQILFGGRRGAQKLLELGADANFQQRH